MERQKAGKQQRSSTGFVFLRELFLSTSSVIMASSNQFSSSPRSSISPHILPRHEDLRRGGRTPGWGGPGNVDSVAVRRRPSSATETPQ